jgi:hypothetical protein
LVERYAVLLTTWRAAAGSALPMFEELELWDSLILCYQMLGKAPQVLHPARHHNPLVVTLQTFILARRCMTPQNTEGPGAVLVS